MANCVVVQNSTTQDVALYEQFLRDQQKRAVHGAELHALLAEIADDLRSRPS